MDINIVVDIARKAGERILEIYHDPSQDWEVEAKSDSSPLTLADRESHIVICEGLQKAFPEIPILSEESTSEEQENRRSWNTFWLVDPLDGTKEFIKRNGEFTVNIALIENGQTTMGVVFVPVQDEMYYASKGKGAYLISNSSEPQLLSTKTYEKGQKGVKIVCSRSHLNEATRTFVEQFNEPELMPTGSSLKFMLVAKGDAHVYPRLGPTMEWDTGAAQCVVEESGGKVIEHPGENHLLYNKESLLNPNFIVYG